MGRIRRGKLASRVLTSKSKNLISVHDQYRQLAIDVYDKEYKDLSEEEIGHLVKIMKGRNK